MTGVNVKSEIGPLKKVILHRPGKELLNLTPDTLERLLFDDIPFLEIAQQEHDAFAQALRDNGVEVVYLEDLMADVIRDNAALRSQFIEEWLEEADIHTPKWHKLLHEYLDANYADPKALVEKTMEGIHLDELEVDRSNSLIDQVSSPTKMVCDPMPNLYFTRDPFAMVGNGVTIHRMYSVTRNRETMYGKYIFDNHPDFKGTPQYYSRDNAFHIEGGDILNINDHVLAIGISQRTEPDAIDTLAQGIFHDERSSIDTILAFDIPNSRAFMHLDTVFTQIDHDKFTIHPGILGPLTVFELTKGAEGEVKVKRLDSDLESILTKYVGQPVQLLQCGAGDRIAAEREQWNDGSNTLCIEPGKICVYQRNNVTNDFLYKNGLELVVIPSCELSRGRGGPRCMSMPAWREDL
ncbi:MAG: arginine deiminase [Eggerthellaceae bacterium]|uniref:Arginine deiminase n=1 Tax=Denitrobacterium detoxificans TaxID=79604 RepID=A0A172RZP5_9ACTN|nr:arginine deiminase [Denitrobacterium detoxificans]ANE23186.1 arginine deiminase [Denitrobacterium detoxificans]MCR5583330.1 arginine deiminase [Eggerthellaceae bacterium]SEO56431.1 arginine deiminase [Denitrobacterium detoxificans]